MHEMGIALQIIEIACAALPEDAGDVQVEMVNLKVGKLTAVVPDSLRFCFNVVSRDTPLAGALLNVEEIPVVVHCADCDLDSTIERPPFVCSKCNSSWIDIVSGQELMVTSLEVEEKGPESPPQE